MTVEKKYRAHISLDHRKKFAQFFTPEPIADLMVRWIVGNPICKTILEPAFGLGIFSRILLKEKPTFKIKGFEIDAKILNEAKVEFKDLKNIELNHQDYMFNDWDNKYDGIICNPPYFKFHDYDNKPIIKEVQKHLKLKLNGFTNLYALFLLKSIYQLRDQGRMAYIIPSEFLNSDYGVFIKSYLLKTGILKHIFIIDFEENVFDDALTTASILLFANDHLSTNVQFSTIKTTSELQIIERFIDNYPKANGEFSYPREELSPLVKWRKYYQVQNSDKYKNLVPFSTYAKVMRGIATGANDYFTFNREKMNRYSIPLKNLLPCICRSKDVKTRVFTNKKFENLVESNATIFLFDGRRAKHKNVLAYISKGEKEKINEKYLTKNRKPWFAIENRPPAPIWVSVFNRNGLKFVRNEANISNLTTFHCIYPKRDNLSNPLNINILFAYLLTPTAKEIFNDNRREYGDGLKKFESNDLNNAKIVNLSLLKDEENDSILEFYRLFKGNENDIYINKIDEIIKKRLVKTNKKYE